MALGAIFFFVGFLPLGQNTALGVFIMLLSIAVNQVKTKVTGYDLVVRGNELSCTADWFIAECQKRMTP